MLEAKKTLVVIRLTEKVLGQAPSDAQLNLAHRIEAARKAIAFYKGREKTKKKDVTYKDALPITNDMVDEQIQALRYAIEDYLGETIPDDVWEQTKTDGLKATTPLFAKLKDVRGITVFPKDKDGFPFFWAYQLKGHIKDLAETYCQRAGFKRGQFLRSVEHTMSLLNRHLYIKDKMNFFYEDEGCTKRVKVKKIFNQKNETFSRPLRAKTASGKRVSIAESEVLPANLYMKFTIVNYIDELNGTKVENLLRIGQESGIAQWRNASFGSYEVLMLKNV